MPFTALAGLRATTSLGGELPPAMQGQLFVVRGDVGAGSWNWFELRENQLTWFEARDGAELHRADLLAAVVATSGALQAQHAKASAVACSFFSIVRNSPCRALQHTSPQPCIAGYT